MLFRSVDGSVGVSIHGLLGNEESDQAFIEDLVGRVRVCMRIRILQDLFDIAAGIFENVFGTARMILDEVGDIVDLVADSDITGVPRVVLFDLGTGEGWKCTSRHSCSSSGRNFRVERCDWRTRGEAGTQGEVLFVDDGEKRRKDED